MPAQVINTRYEIIETEARGAGAVFAISKARDTVSGRVVTLQTLPVEPAADSERRASFQAAVVEAMRLEHPNIVHVYEQGENQASGELFVVSEYLRGITLQERIRRVAPFSLAVAADIAVAVVEALDSAHRAGVLHGDLRPRSVLLSPEGQMKVGDFAYARVASPAFGAGSPPPTVADDIASAGALLYEMLTGAAPAPGDGPAPSPRAVNAGVPPALDGLVQKAMHPDPAIRYRTATTLLLDLQAVRDALRTGRSLTWSPLIEARGGRTPASEATVVAARPADLGLAAVGVGEEIRAAREPRAATPLAEAASELEEERYPPVERERPNPLGKILVALFVVAVLGVIVLVWYFSQMLSIPNDVQVPNLVGKTMDEAKQIAAQQHFTVTEGGSDYSAKWPQDQIYQQAPLPGRTIKASQSVSVFRSLGPRLLKVPRLVGETKSRAVSDLNDAGLPEGTVTEEYSTTIQKGVVLGQAPDADAMVARSTAVSFRVSKGPQPPDPPDDVEADAPAQDTANVHWTPAPHADSYTVYRLLDGGTTTVAKGLVDTHFTDHGLKPDTTYTYTVDAVNAAGASGPSSPALVTTPAEAVASPVLPSDTQVVTPDAGAPSPADGSSGVAPTAPDQPAPAARMRQFTINFRVPRHPRGARHVQFEVQDVTGTNLVYDENKQGGDEVSAPIQAFGNKITFRIFLDGKLIKQQTL